MKTEFVWTRETEIERLAFTVVQLARGFYQDQGFVVVPELEKGGVREVVVPKLEYELKVWQLARGVSVALPMKTESRLFDLLSDAVGESLALDDEKLSRVADDWGEISESFWDFAKEVVPEGLGLINTVEVRLTSWGSVSSYGSLEADKAGQKLVCYVRWDVGIAHLAEIILTGLVWPFAGNLGLGWSEVEAMVDWWVAKSRLAEVVGEYEPTLVTLKEASKGRLEVSRKYVAGLGLVVKKKEFSLANGKLLLEGKAVESKLSHNECLLLKEMVSKSDEVVSYEKLADLIWGEGGEYSLWAINRAVSRLRKKLEGMGVGDRLQVVYGRGYVWRSG